jgi:hypothetical protein
MAPARKPGFAMLIDLTCCSRTHLIVAATPFVMLALVFVLCSLLGIPLNEEGAKWPAWLFLAAFFWGYGVLAQATLAKRK